MSSGRLGKTTTTQCLSLHQTTREEVRRLVVGRYGDDNPAASRPHSEAEDGTRVLVAAASRPMDVSKAPLDGQWEIISMATSVPVQNAELPQSSRWEVICDCYPNHASIAMQLIIAAVVALQQRHVGAPNRLWRNTSELAGVSCAIPDCM
jgi:hypothetical protein